MKGEQVTDLNAALPEIGRGDRKAKGEMAENIEIFYLILFRHRSIS
jgi:hypothetical protein